ncbi:MAG: HPr family phosphocarrier protein [Pseudomonadota bacterium]
MREASVTIVNQLGLHTRAASVLVRLATTFEADITLAREDGKPVNGKSIMGVMLLAATQGTTVRICADGSDEADALAALTQLVRDRFGEDE